MTALLKSSDILPAENSPNRIGGMMAELDLLVGGCLRLLGETFLADKFVDNASDEKGGK